LTAVNPQLALDQQIKQVQDVGSKLSPLHQALRDIEPLDRECEEAGIDDNEETIYNLEDLKFDLDTMETAVKKKSSFLQNQTVLRTKTDIAPEKLEEYQSSFKLLDRDQTNSLNRVEFKAALSAMGYSLEDSEAEKLFLQVSKGGDEITFEPFIDWAKSAEEDVVSKEQLQQAFSDLAGEKGHVTEEDLIRVGIPKENAKSLVEKMHGDFKSFLGNTFS
jgi:Ca2+-binding EF-hand superfamily protein